MFSHAARSTDAVSFPFSFFSVAVSTSLSRTYLGRHAARLRRFLSSPDPGDAFTAVEISGI